MSAVMAAGLAFPEFDPVVVHIWGPIAIRWYGLAYMTGILLGWWLLRRLCRAPGAPMSEAHVDDFVLLATAGVVVGGRLGSILFYNFDRYLEDPTAALRVWEGGMSFHGGVIGVSLAILWFTRRHKLAGLRFHDYIATVVPIGLGLGRIANFINGELYGRATSVPWAMVFPGSDGQPRHPSQLYEAALEGALLLAILLWLFYKTDARRRPGLLVGVFILGYGIFRFLVEFVREPDANLGILPWAITMGQTLCVPMIAGGIYLVARALRQPKI
jgi:phosphatidylglycerol---prolipoprotein diacylglyceryl transferase